MIPQTVRRSRNSRYRSPLAQLLLLPFAEPLSPSQGDGRFAKAWHKRMGQLRWERLVYTKEAGQYNEVGSVESSHLSPVFVSSCGSPLRLRIYNPGQITNDIHPTTHVSAASARTFSLR
jgi:hypothetical protein